MHVENPRQTWIQYWSFSSKQRHKAQSSSLPLLMHAHEKEPRGLDVELMRQEVQAA